MRIVSNAVRIGSLSWLVAHFSLTVLYVMPANPINMAIQPLLAATIGTYFAQNWSLFAPNPIASDEALLVRCLSAAEAESAAWCKPDDTAESAVALPSDGWYDISTPFWKQFQRNRFSPYDRLVRTQTNAVRQFMGSGSVSEWRGACEHGSKEACETFEKLLKAEKEAAGASLRRIACAFCLANSPAPERLSRVALRLRETSSIPWSQRYEKVARKVEDFDLESYPIERNIETLSVFGSRELP